MLFRAQAFVVAISGTALLAGCISVPDLGALPAISEVDRSADILALLDSTDDLWWESYGDPQLNDLIAEALRNSPDMSTAAARLHHAESYMILAEGAGGSSYSIASNPVLQRQSYNNGFPRQFLPQGWQDHGEASFRYAYDFDFWHQNRAELEAATSELIAAQIDQHQARLLLTTEIARVYVELSSLYVERDFRQEAVIIREASRDLVEQRHNNGLDTLGNLRLSEANVASAKADLAATEETISLKRNELSMLIGAGPDRSSDFTRPQFENLIRHVVPETASIDLIARRPDIAAARARAEAEMTRIDVARGNYYPSIRLSALIGVQSLGLENLLSTDSMYGNVGPAFSLPLFNQGTLESGLRTSRANYELAAARYSTTVLSALREVADVLVSIDMLDTRVSEINAAVAASEEAYDIARQRYQGGLSTYIDVLNVEERLLQARAGRAQLNSRAVQLDIALIRALGGGFQTTTNSPETISLRDEDIKNG